MPSSSSRSRVPVRRSPRPASRTADVRAGAAERPPVVPFAAVFGLLVAVEDGYLAWLLRTPELGWDWFVIVPLALALLAVVASAAVFLGRARGWLWLTIAAVLPLLGILALVVFFALLGGGQAMWSAVLLLVGPLGALFLAPRRPVREWTGPARARRPAGGRRTVGSSR
jgi:hypothetical protein